MNTDNSYGKNKNIFLSFKAFTLVELIVVITILAILGTIGFISIGGYTLMARESARISDMSMISRALDLTYLENNFYPDTASGITVTYSGSTLWTQGFFTEEVRANTNRISQTPSEKLTGKPYIYSVTYNRQEYQLAGGSESGGPTALNSLVPETNAFFSRAIVRGNYNGAILGKNISDRLHIFGVPSIITKNIDSVDIVDLINQKGFVLDGYGALPNSFATNTGAILGEVNFTPSNAGNVLIFDGTPEELISYSGALLVAQKSYDLYNGTGINNHKSLNPYIVINPSTSTNQQKIVHSTLLSLSTNKTVSPGIESILLTGVSNHNPTNEPEVVEEVVVDNSYCYNPTNIGTIGLAGTVCDGMLIVSDVGLSNVSSPDRGGNGQYGITGPDSNFYTFTDSQYNVFTGIVTNMEGLFRRSNFNGDIGYWDVSNVVNMHSLFRETTAFNQDISGWDVSSVTNMFEMVRESVTFSSNIGSWDVSNVTNMSAMFRDSGSFNQNLTGWCVSNFAVSSSDFARDSILQAGNRPIWGTCP
ncbi:BspA family leucine-rich repeat surface protein [Candidatus Gracilibacteria bacterium]|nr:BspA family leucine-rich repeat surface protein [Candidatus Gracilibacteria bacterium]